MASFPALFDGVVALHPLNEGIRIPVSILQFDDYTEQRWVDGAALRRFTLELEAISQTAKNSLRDFFDSVKGGFDKTWDITVSGVLYSNMVFETDVFVYVEPEANPERWNLTLPCRQVRKT